MKTKKRLFRIILLSTFGYMGIMNAQIPSNVYFFQEENDGKIRYHELKISGDYLINTVYEMKPAKFIKTMGGYFTTANDSITVVLEFNSDFKNDSIAELVLPYTITNDKLIVQTNPKQEYLAPEILEQELDGHWLFGARGPDTGQERRGDSGSRKTLKALQNNTFQWIAYDTETMAFKGTGGGSFSSEDGVYVEKINFFSRDDARVGDRLEFAYELKGNDWHHTGNNSKGEPMYEIWQRRLLNEQ